MSLVLKRVSDSGVSSKLTRWNRADNISPRVEEMIKDYTELPFPSELAGFGDPLAVYVRNHC